MFTVIGISDFYMTGLPVYLPKNCEFIPLVFGGHVSKDRENKWI